MTASRHAPIGWGILGTGNVAGRFASDFSHIKDARLLGVGSRRQDTARTFGERFNVSRRYGSYQALVNDSDITVVYIATPASFHKDHMKMCLTAGKAVLCEKPFTLTGDEAEEVIALAGLKHVFLMEAMWTRFLPIMEKLRELLTKGAIGEIRHFMGDLGSQAPFDSQNRLFNPHLGGGALLHRGIYLVSLATMILGHPAKATKLSINGKTGIDEETGFLLEYASQALATLWCSLRVRGLREGTIMGTTGLIKIHSPIHCPSCLTLQQFPVQETSQASGLPPGMPSFKNRLIRYAKGNWYLRILRERFPVSSNRVFHGIQTTTYFDPPIGEGLHYQISEVNRCLREGRVESPIMPWEESLKIMRTMDQILHR